MSNQCLLHIMEETVKGKEKSLYAGNYFNPLCISFPTPEQRVTLL